jgi:hypothetical protein
VVSGSIAAWVMREGAASSSSARTIDKNGRPWHNAPRDGLILVPFLVLFCVGATIGYLLPTRYAEGTGPILGAVFAIVGVNVIARVQRARRRSR